MAAAQCPNCVLAFNLRRNPFFPKYFLSVGDWTWCVWNEDLRSPLLVSPYAGAYLSSGTWSPTRPGQCSCKVLRGFKVYCVQHRLRKGPAWASWHCQ
jgi:hypothetical protein